MLIKVPEHPAKRHLITNEDKSGKSNARLLDLTDRKDLQQSSPAPISIPSCFFLQDLNPRLTMSVMQMVSMTETFGS